MKTYSISPAQFIIQPILKFYKVLILVLFKITLTSFSNHILDGKISGVGSSSSNYIHAK